MCTSMPLYALHATLPQQLSRLEPSVQRPEQARLNTGENGGLLATCPRAST